MAVPYFGDFAEDDTVLIPFNTFDSNDPQASVTITNLADADIMVHKDGGLTQIATDGATVVINFDSITGNHLITVDTSASADYAVGSEYAVRIEGTTVDAGTINAWVGAFSIERAGGALAITKLIQAAVITNAAGTDVAADIIAIKAETALIVADTNELQTDDVPGLIATAQADLDIITGADGAILLSATQASIDAIETDTGTTIPGTITTLQADTDDIQTRLPAALVGGLMSSDITAISTDTIAADNLESQYDTTGLTGDTFPSTQSQLSSITNVGSAIHKPAESYTLTTGTQSANLFSDTQALNGVRHTHTDTTGAIEFYYEFNIGSGTASSVQVTGYVNGPNDDVDVYGYDWVAAAWVQIGNIQGASSTANGVYSFDMFVDMVGGTGNEGVVRVRFYKASGLTTATIAIDQIFIAFSQGAEGYDNGAVWLDTDFSNTNTVVGIDGVARNPVSTIAAANTLLASTNLHRIEVSPGSSVTLAASQTGQTFSGHDWTLALGGQDVSGTVFFGATVSGIGTSPTEEVRFSDCDISTMSIGSAHFHECGFTSVTITLTAAGSYVMNDCYSQVAGAGTPTIDFGAALGNTALNIAHYANGIQIDNLNATGTDSFSISGDGQIVYAASSSGTVNQRGNWKVTNTGGVTINEDDNTSNIAATLVDTNELQADWVDGGRLDLLLDRLITEMDTATTEPAQGAPGVSVKRGEKIDWLYKMMRNRSTSTSSTISVYADDATTVDHKITHSDDATTYDRGEMATGP